MRCIMIAPLVVLLLTLQMSIYHAAPADYIQFNPCDFLTETDAVGLRPIGCEEKKSTDVDDGLYRLFVYDHGLAESAREPETEVVVGIEKNSTCSIYVRSSLEHSELLFIDVCNSTKAWSSEYTIPTRNRLHLATLVPGQYEPVVGCKDVGNALFGLDHHEDTYWANNVLRLTSSDAFKCIEGNRFGSEGAEQGPFKAIRVYNRLRRYNFAILLFTKDDQIKSMRLYVPIKSGGKTGGLCGRQPADGGCAKMLGPACQSVGSCSESSVKMHFANWRLDKADQRPLYRHNFVYAHRIGWPLNP